MTPGIGLASDYVGSSFSFLAISRRKLQRIRRDGTLVSRVCVARNRRPKVAQEAN